MSSETAPTALVAGQNLLTTGAHDPAAMGRAAAELLFRRMDGDRFPSVHEVIPTRPIPRGSGEISP